MLCPIPMTRCIINCGNNNIEVCALSCLIFKIPLNKSNDNYCRGVSHKPTFEGLPSECDGVAAIVGHDYVSM